ncbi:MAG: PEGA domain-containing protein, partial [Deltaproteobacteria bacterium]|nr:PEGA domain-containing protein [Deltaproteobacteria bacterium]
LLGMSPFANVSLPPGKHRLRFMNPQRRTLTRTVLIRPGRVTKLRFSLR